MDGVGTRIISSCYNTGNIQVTGGDACGIGYYAETKNCYNSGSITATNSELSDDIRNRLSAIGISKNMEYDDIINCYNIGDIIGDGSAYGIARWEYYLECNFGNCYNNGKVISPYGIAYGCFGGQDRIDKSKIIDKIINMGEVSGKIAAFGATGTTGLTNIHYLSGQVYVDGVQKTDDEYTKTQEEINDLIKPVLEVINSNESNVFIEDTNNINNGLPILKWQKEY